MKRKAFLFLQLGDGFQGIAQRLNEEGYSTFLWTTPEVSRETNKGAGKGLVNIIDDPHDILNQYVDRKDQLIIWIDDNSQGDWMDYLKKEGWKVVGSSHSADEIEHNRDTGRKLAEKIGLTIPPTMKFTGIDEAITYITKLGKKSPDLGLVFKGDGIDLAGGSYTYLAQSPSDMIYYLNWLKNNKECEGKLDKFAVQIVVNGIEIDLATWFNGNKFLPVMPITFEQKRVHGLGAAQGCLGQILCYADPRKEPYFQKYFSKLAPILTGSVPNEWAINNIIAEDTHKPNFLEWTPRCFPYYEMLMAKVGDNDGQLPASVVYTALKSPVTRDKVMLMTPNGYSKVIDCAYKKYTGDMYKIAVHSSTPYQHSKILWDNSKTFSVTADHLIKTERGFVKAEDLKEDDKIIAFGKRPYHNKLFNLPITKIEKEAVTDIDVYDFKVADPSHEIRLPNGVIVHNCGWDAFIGELAILQDAGRSIGEFMIAIAEGTSLPKGFFPYYKYSAAVRLFSGSTGAEKDKVWDRPIQWKPEHEKNFWWYGVKRNDDGTHVLTGNPFGVAAVVGDSVDEAVAKLYDLVKPSNENITTPDIWYSETIGEHVSEDIAKLQEWGVLSKYET